MSKIEVEGSGVGGQKIKLDGLDISNIASSVDIDLRPGGRIEVNIELVIDGFKIDSPDTNVLLNGDSYSIGQLEPLYDLLKSHFEVAQRLSREKEVSSSDKY